MRRAREIIPGKLYMGSHPAKWPEGRDDWLAENVGAVVTLAKRDPGIDIPTVTSWHYPVKDGNSIDPRIPEQVVPWITQCVRGGVPVLVCCLAGRSRSGATAALVVRELTGMSGSEALDYVRERRPNAVKRDGPEAELRALPALEVANPEQLMAQYAVPA